MIYDLCIHVGSTKKDIEYFLKICSVFGKSNFNVQLFAEENQDTKVFSENKDIVLLPIISPKKFELADNIRFLTSIGISNFRSLYFTEQKKKELKEHIIVEKTNDKVSSCRSLLKKVPLAKNYLTFASDELIVNIFRVFAKQNKGHLFFSRYSVIPDRFFISPIRDQVVQNKTHDYNFDEKKWATEYIENYTKKKTILWANPEDRNPKIIDLLNNFFLKLLNPRKVLNLFKYNKQGIAFFSLKVLMRRLYYKYKSNKLYTNQIGSNYIYFPMHFPIDSQLTNRGIPFINQANLIEIISNYLPFQYTLLVKEHPLARGYSKFSDLLYISKLPNVQLVHPYVNSHNLIAKSKAIIVVNSSVGFESMMYQKPVITLGKSFYRNSGLTIDVDSLYHLKDAFDNIESFHFNNDIFIDFLCRIREHTIPLNYFDLANCKESIIDEYVTHLLKFFSNN